MEPTICSCNTPIKCFNIYTKLKRHFDNNTILNDILKIENECCKMKLITVAKKSDFLDNDINCKK